MKWMALGVLLAGASIAQAAPPADYDVSAAFAEADVNKDGSVEINEYYDRLVETYFHADTDKNGTLSKEEFVKAVVIEEDFAQVDIDANGNVDRREFVRSRLPLFQASDTNHDGGLSLDEVKAALAKGNDP
jgi:Ca2+-binding EF-hand superfamily protein